MSDHNGRFQGCADLATKFFGADAARNLFDMLIDIKNAKELADEAEKAPCENCGKPMELTRGQSGRGFLRAHSIRGARARGKFGVQIEDG